MLYRCKMCQKIVKDDDRRQHLIDHSPAYGSAPDNPDVTHQQFEELTAQDFQKMANELVNEGGCFCPVCEATDGLDYANVEIMEGRAYQKVTCNKCGAVWVEGYTMDSVSFDDEDGEGSEFHYAEALAKTQQPQTCDRCGADMAGEELCPSRSCPFSEHYHDCPRGWVGHPDHPEANDAKCTCPPPLGPPTEDK